MAKHTEGEWIFRRDEEGGVFVTGGGRIIANMVGPVETRKGNGRLIAAAPELLVRGKHLAVKLAEAYRAAGQSPKDCQAIREWMEAVAIAEGRS